MTVKHKDTRLLVDQFRMDMKLSGTKQMLYMYDVCIVLKCITIYRYLLLVLLVLKYTLYWLLKCKIQFFILFSPKFPTIIPAHNAICLKLLMEWKSTHNTPAKRLQDNRKRPVKQLAKQQDVRVGKWSSQNNTQK